MAPEMRATVMIANVAWNATKASGGYAAPFGTSSRLFKPIADQSIVHGAMSPLPLGNAIA
jgi:hypothetical protein